MSEASVRLPRATGDFECLDAWAGYFVSRVPVVPSGIEVFGDEGGAASSLWQIPISGTDVRALAAPDLVARLPYPFALMIAAAVLTRYLRGRPLGAAHDGYVSKGKLL